MQSAIKVENLHKTYAPNGGNKGTHALRGLDLDIKKGEFFALLGPNGSGKTTFINILAGPTLKSKGKVEILGSDIDTHRVKTKFLLGVVPQEISFDSFFTVNEILELQSGYYGIRNNGKHIDEILSKLGLKEKKFTNSRALSGGMKRRLLIAKALIHKPEVLILDEPTAGVDVELRRSMWKYMKQLNEEGLTILLTTHYLEEAEQLCSRTAIIHNGKLVALDKTSELTKEKTLEDVFVELTYESDTGSGTTTDTKPISPNKRANG
ncbi:MAG: ABC transporter ATP-binding protein [bacterium]|nr:ABC transporter ATP-binding protein [bacterium]